MAPNESTNGVDQSTTMAGESARRHQLVSDRTEQLIFTVLSCGVTPTISLVGVCLNVMSIRVLVRHGLHKCSNILLVALACMDLLFPISYNNIPYLIYTWDGGRFVYSYPMSYFLFVAYMVFVVLDYTSAISAVTFPMLITMERLVAVFLPMKAHRIVTPPRTWAAVTSVVLIYLVLISYSGFWFQLSYTFDSTLNRSVGIIVKSDLFYTDLPNIDIFIQVVFNVKIPPVFTLLGCIAIIVKVKMMAIARKKMTSTSRPISKTTKTLLAVCIVYLCNCTIASIPAFLPEEYSSYSLTEDNPTNVSKLIYHFINLSTQLNCTWNFFAYYAFNKHFRDILKELVGQCCRRCRYKQ